MRYLTFSVSLIPFSLTDFTELKVKIPKQYEKSRLTYGPKERYQVGSHTATNYFFSPNILTFYCAHTHAQVHLGENLTVPCLASGNPKPEIIWTREGDNRRIPAERSDGCLRIRGAEEADAGRYMCAFYNGARRFLRRTTVVVLTPPAFTK